LGVALATVLVLTTKTGVDNFQKAYNWSAGMTAKEKDEAFVDVLNVIEMMLCYFAWYDRAEMWEIKDHRARKKVHQAIATMIACVTKVIPRNIGYGWNLSKTHELMHGVFNITRFGHPTNFDEGLGKWLLKFMAKLPAATAQTLGMTTFLKQVCSRIQASICIQKARRGFGMDDDREDYIKNYLDPGHAKIDRTKKFDVRNPQMYYSFSFDCDEEAEEYMSHSMPQLTQIKKTRQNTTTQARSGCHKHSSCWTLETTCRGQRLGPKQNRCYTGDNVWVCHP
jgi:hypothetical protein